MAGRQDHWNSVYRGRSEEELTWFEETPSTSLKLVRLYLKPGDNLIDIGAGASRLVDALLDDGFTSLSVLDLSGSALDLSRERLGTRGDSVEWIEADVTSWRPRRAYAVWHDRAVFHFLTQGDERQAYANVMAEALQPAGVAIIATFADDGPEKCSGLPVVRYTSEGLAQVLNSLVPGKFEMINSRRHVHITPKGNRQSFQYSVFRRKHP
ncbi:MAG: class I SAM-dependent methyltransferase [Marivita sp.]|nr:class I SAM-dependent methyltransferase [Marivita sp.]